MDVPPRLGGPFAASLLAFALAACGGATAQITPTAGTSPAAPARDTAAKIADAMEGIHRSEASRARDKHRHPRETLAFFGLKDDMTVVEIFPGAGWYTDLLAPVLAERGKLVCTRSDALVKQKEQRPGTFGKVELLEFDGKAGKVGLGPDGSADLVLTFRNVHNWMMGGYEKDVFASAFRVLKKGGVLGVVEHRAKPGTDAEVSKKIGYVDEALVVKVAEGAGFKLDARSEINANAKDTKDHPEGVWTLPPTLKLGEKDKAKYLEIGESDRMTLRFVKP